MADMILKTLGEQVDTLDGCVGVERKQALGESIDGIFGLCVRTIARLGRLDLCEHLESVDSP